MRLKIYFGHPVNVYDTELEQVLIRLISQRFPQFDIENPNQKHHSDGYAEWKRTTGNGMDYYFQAVLPECHAGIFLPFRDGMWGAGVYQEARFLAEQGRSIHQITFDGFISPVCNINILTVDETRARIRTPDEKIIPY